MKKSIVLTAVSCLCLVGCFDDGTRLTLYDGYSMGGMARKDVAASTFRVTTPHGGGWKVVEFTVPDSRIADLPLDLSDVAVTCQLYAGGVANLETDAARLRIVEARHDGLVAEYAYSCDGTTVEGHGLFEVAGSPRDGVWAYAPDPPPSTLGKLLDTARYAAAGVL